MGPAQGESEGAAGPREHPWSEHAFRNALETATASGVAGVSPDGQQVYVNPAFCAMVGWSADELLGARPPYVYWPPEEEARIHQALRTTLDGQAPPEGFELRLLRRSGERFDACLLVAPVRGESGKTEGWVATVSDISARRRNERRRAAETELARVLGLSSSILEGADPSLRAICEHLGWDAASLWRVDHGGVLCPLAEVWRERRDGNGGSLLDHRDFVPDRSLPGRALASAEPVWAADLEQVEGFARSAVTEPEGLRTGLAVPIEGAAGVVGLLELFSRERRAPEAEALADIAAVARQIGQCVEREQAQLALRHSEERYRAIVETANEGVWLIDHDGRTVYANSRLAGMLGVSQEEMRRANVHDFCFPEDALRAGERIEANLEGRFEQFDFRFRRRDGTELLTLACTSPMRDGAGRVVGVLGMFSDVTERKKAEEAVHRLAAIVESSDDAIIGKTLDGIIQSWNSAAERIYGYTAEEAAGRSMTMLLPPDRPDEERLILERLNRGERLDHFETVRVRKDGRTIDVSMTVSPIRDKEGRIIGASSVTRDITERRRFEEQLRETQKLESLGVLAGGVAHDFNNLLVGIMGNASLAIETVPESNPAHTMIQGVLQASERAANLTRQLLAYSGKGRFVVQPTGMSQLIREILVLIQTSIPKGVRVRLELDEHLPTIDADVAQIQQLVMNLVINGAEAIGDAGGTVTIRTSVVEAQAAGEEQFGPHVLLDVEDTGCGMDQATRERIFDPFFTTKFTGRGLGLAAVLGIVRGHRGTIQVESAPGQGTRFSVSFPASAGTAAPPRPRVEQDWRGSGTILVVDDEEIVRETAKSTLEHFGYEVLLAADGQEALECLRRAPQVGLVLLDLTMPVMSGEEALIEMRRLRPDLRVILSSGYNEIEAIRRFQGQGLSGFLQKPYTAEVLGEKVKAVGAVQAPLRSRRPRRYPRS